MKGRGQAALSTSAWDCLTSSILHILTYTVKDCAPGRTIGFVDQRAGVSLALKPITRILSNRVIARMLAGFCVTCMAGSSYLLLFGMAYCSMAANRDECGDGRFGVAEKDRQKRCLIWVNGRAQVIRVYVSANQGCFLLPASFITYDRTNLLKHHNEWGSNLSMACSSRKPQLELSISSKVYVATIWRFIQSRHRSHLTPCTRAKADEGTAAYC
eukprot:scaffold168748_cov32-Prasinocladus_malaysianus.AAC.1